MVCINVIADRPASEPFSVFLMPMSMLRYQSASSESYKCISVFSVISAKYIHWSDNYLSNYEFKIRVGID